MTRATTHHLLTASGDMLLITSREGVNNAPAASFKAPQPILSVQCQGATICVECEGGAVCILQAPFLARVCGESQDLSSSRG